jgi:haloacetate dehalogenase
MIDVMKTLGFDQFLLAGHDRGGRVAYRLALDHRSRVKRLAVLDVLPNGTMWDHADARLALAFWPWSLLAQPEPLPERLIVAAPRAVVEDALSNWDTPRDFFPQHAFDAYVEGLSQPDHVHAICEEYRAGASIDREHDQADRVAGRRIQCPLLALWSAKGGLAKWYDELGGPLELWREWANDVEGCSIEGGHFFPEEKPHDVARALSEFFLTSDP